jgi:hypothetical protein
MAYEVEGFFEVSDAVRRGHAVIVRRSSCEVSPGSTVFAGTPDGEVQLVTIRRFDPTTARYEVDDPFDGTGAGLQLTPRRLAVYLAHPERESGVALAG